MTRHYTPEQTAARLAYTRAWRKRNKERIKAYDAAYRPRAAMLAKRRRKANPEKYRKQALAWSRKHLAKRARYQREYRRRQLAKNPNWNRQRWLTLVSNNPNYQREYRKRKQLRDAWQRFSKTCALSRTKTVVDVK